jgi:hypothetical protein
LGFFIITLFINVLKYVKLYFNHFDINFFFFFFYHILPNFIIVFILVIEYMVGGEIQWKDENDRPVMSTDEARQIFRDVVLGLEYRK